MSILVSVVMPTYNRKKVLEQTLLAYDRQSFSPEEFEVIVIDDGSSDGTEEMVLRLKVSYPLIYIKQINQGSAVARNTGVKKARGEVILFVDDDGLPHIDFVKEHYLAHQKKERIIVRGPIINTSCLEVRDREILPWLHFSMNFFCTANVSIKMKSFLETGFFDPRFRRRQDAEYGVRLRKIGIRRIFNLRAIVYHYKPRMSVESICQWAVEEGKNAAFLFYTHPNIRMKLATGMYWLNYVQGGIFSNSILVNLYKHILNLPSSKLLPWLEAILVRFIVTHYYLKSARYHLRLLKIKMLKHNNIKGNRE